MSCCPFPSALLQPSYFHDPTSCLSAFQDHVISMGLEGAMATKVLI